ncbi:penicillin-binding protein 2 [Parapedomonas caeni]
METEADRQHLFTRRALLVGAGQATLFTVLAGRAAYLSVFQNEHYKLLAEDNRVSIRPILPRRGLIVDRRGYPLALNRQDYRLALVPEQVKDLEATLDAIARHFPLTEEDRDTVRKMVRRVPGFMPVEVARDIDWQAFSALNVNMPQLAGLQPIQGYTRYYPDGPAVAHVLGYVGSPSAETVDADPDPMLRLPGFKVGKGGIEEIFDTRLRGRAGADKVEVNARGRVVRTLGRTQDTPGDTIELTLDRELQVFTAWRLQGEAGSAIVMDVETGEILALCSTPAFDPNSFSAGIKTREWKALLGDEMHPLLNKPFQGVYPPGSTFKMLTALAGLASGVTPEEGISCSGRYRLGSHYFHCWERRGHGFVNMHSGIFQSCDVYFYDLGRRIGIQAIADMARKFGLGERYDLPVPSQKRGLVPDPAWKLKRHGKKWLPGETLNASIGQGYLQVTPLQLAVMSARLASGRAVVPRLLRKDVRPAPLLDVPAEHLALVRQAMSDVVNSSRGTAIGARLRLPGLAMAGKTGTAQVRRITMAERRGGVRSNDSLPWRERDHALFVSFAPVDRPRYACAVVIDHGGSGSKAAAPVARDILSFLFKQDIARGDYRTPSTAATQPAAGNTDEAASPAGTPADAPATAPLPESPGTAVSPDPVAASSAPPDTPATGD